MVGLEWGAWNGGPGMGGLVWGAWNGGPGMGGLVWGAWNGGPGMGGLVWGPGIVRNVPNPDQLNRGNPLDSSYISLTTLTINTL